MREIKIKTPAKINFTLDVIGRRNDGFHNIDSIMQSISLYDFLTIKIEKSDKNEIFLSGTSDKIPYNEKNIAYKAVQLYLDYCKIQNQKIFIHIEKNIPIAAGLAGGSANASGTLFGLNKLFGNILSEKKLHFLASQLGSDLNFCLMGGCIRCTGRGEFLKPLPVFDMSISLIKPKNLEISAKFAYQNFDSAGEKQSCHSSEKMAEIFEKGEFDSNFVFNDLESAVLPKFDILKKIKQKMPYSFMSGSGPTFFVINENISNSFSTKDFEIFNNLKTIPDGVKEV